jgi:putative NIF3 family GTP cyclohydrolase 1 type 2
LFLKSKEEGKVKIEEIYKLAIELGMKADPREKGGVKKALQAVKESYEKLSDKEKKFFDLEKLENPYSDTRVLTGDLETEVSGVMAGIDINVSEILLADRLREKGYCIDLIISHHPAGKALAALHEVMNLQADVWHKFGVPINIGDALISERAREVFRAFLPMNHTRATDAAKLLGIPMMCVHTPADNLVTRYLQKLFDEKEPYKVSEVLDALKKIPEYEKATMENVGPTLIVGEPSRRAGKIMVDMTGGTEGPKGAVEKLSEAGVGTLVCMHMSEDMRKRAEGAKVNVVVAGHIASDSLGLNLFLDELERSNIEIIACSGFIRVKRS